MNAVFFMLFSVRKLLNSGVSPDLVNEDGLTALHQVQTQIRNSFKHGEPWRGLDGDVGQSSQLSHIVLSDLSFVQGYSPADSKLSVVNTEGNLIRPAFFSWAV